MHRIARFAKLPLSFFLVLAVGCELSGPTDPGQSDADAPSAGPAPIEQDTTAGETEVAADALSAAAKKKALTFEPPVELTIDLHVDPFAQVELSARRKTFRRQCDNARWLLETLEGTGARVTFLAVPELYEFCGEASERSHCYPLLQALYESGGSLGTHTHAEVRMGPHDWPQQPGDPGDAVSEKSWSDAVAVTDAVVGEALGLASPAEIRAVNNIHGSHLPKSGATYDALMEQFGFDVLQSGPEEDFFGLFGHHIWTVYRPSPANWMTEDPDTSYVLVPSGPVIGKAGIHKGILQDMSVPRVKAMFLQLLTNRRARMLSGAPDTIWTFGFAMHTTDIEEGSDTRVALEETVSWLNAGFAGKTSKEGHLVARWSGRRDVAARFRALETKAPGREMFSYPTTKASSELYPYLLPVAGGLRDALFVGAVNLGSGTTAWELSRNGEPVVLLWGDTAKTVDLASVFGSATVRLTDAATGFEVEAKPGQVQVAAGTASIVSLAGATGGGSGASSAPAGHCGDGVCDKVEKAKPQACPADCQ